MTKGNARCFGGSGHFFLLVYGVWLFVFFEEGCFGGFAVFEVEFVFRFAFSFLFFAVFVFPASEEGAHEVGGGVDAGEDFGGDGYAWVFVGEEVGQGAEVSGGVCCGVDFLTGSCVFFAEVDKVAHVLDGDELQAGV